MSIKDALNSEARLVDVWAVHSKASERDGGVPTWWFLDKLVAEACAVNKGWYGGQGL